MQPHPSPSLPVLLLPISLPHPLLHKNTPVLQRALIADEHGSARLSLARGSWSDGDTLVDTRTCCMEAVAGWIKNGSCKRRSAPVSAQGVCFIKARRAAEPVTFRYISQTTSLPSRSWFNILGSEHVHVRLLSSASRTKWFIQSGLSSLSVRGILAGHRILRESVAALLCSCQCDKKTKTTFNLYY